MTIEEFKALLGEKKANVRTSNGSKNKLLTALRNGPLSTDEVAYLIYENRTKQEMSPLNASSQAPMRINHLRRDGYTIIKNSAGQYQLIEETVVPTDV